MMVLIIGFCGKDPPNFYWENLTLSMAIFSGYFKLPEGTASFVSLFYVLRNLDLNRIWLLFLEPTNTVILNTLEWCVCIHNIYIYKYTHIYVYIYIYTHAHTHTLVMYIKTCQF